MGVKDRILGRQRVRVGDSQESRSDCLHEGIAEQFFGLTVLEERLMIGGLLEMVKGLVADYNRIVGDEVLYFSEYVSVWALFARRGKNQCDACVATGFSTVGDLAALVDRLQNEEVLA